MSQLLKYTGFFDGSTFGSSETVDNLQCYLTTRLPKISDWTIAYHKDNDTSIIFTGLTKYKDTIWTTTTLNKLTTEYKLHLQKKGIQLLHGKLILMKAIFKNIRYVGLIVVPSSLRYVIFSRSRAGPTGGHTGGYKTPFRIQMRFWWPSMCKDITNWVKCCAHCCAYDIWRNWKSEVYFLWPVTTPFYIMHIDLWDPGRITDENGGIMQLMNVMCDLTQCIVSTLVTNATSKILGKLFMEQVVFTFGIVAVVVVDADSKVLHLFEEM